MPQKILISAQAQTRSNFRRKTKVHVASVYFQHVLNIQIDQLNFYSHLKDSFNDVRNFKRIEY